MNREDLIAKHARAYALAELEKIGSNQTIWFTAPLFDSEDLQTAYLQGAKDAEDNPAWRMCEEELPDKPCNCVCHDGERMFFAEWVDDTPQGLKGWSINGLTAQPIAWLPLPKFKV